MTLCRSPVPPAREFSPLQVGHGYARTELSDLSERSNERLGEGFGDVVEQSDGLVTTVPDDLGVRPEREAALAMDGADTKGVDHGTSEATVQEAVVEEVNQPIQSGIRDSAACNESVEGVQIAGIVSEPRSSTPVESDERDSHCHAALPSRRDQRIASWGCDAGTDSKPVYSWRKHGSEIMVPKRRQQPTRSPSDCNSLHLDDMNIPHALASPSLMSSSITPRLLSQNQLVDENRRDSVLGSRSASDSSAAARRESNQHQRDISSSFYSPGSSSSSVPAGNPPPSTWGHSGIEKYLHKLYRQAGSRSLGFDGPGSYLRARFSEASESSAAESSNAATIEVLRSSYIDGFEKDAAVDDVGTSETRDGATTRKVSAGWMSGGRRIGYGYSMVTPDEKENIGSQAGGSRSTSAAAYGSSVSVNTIPSMISRLSQRQFSGTDASLKAPTSKDPTEADSFSSPIWARVANRMKSRNGSAFNSTRTIPGHWPVSGSEHGSGRQRSPPKRMSILENKDGGLLRRMTRIYSASSLQTRRRNATENMHDIKERVSAKASGIYQPLLQRKESGDFRLRALSRGKGRVHDDGTAGLSPLKNCGWTRADRSANWLAGPDVTTGSERKTSEQIGSDDTTEELAYQDCLEDIPA